jgi:hypothetical protein
MKRRIAVAAALLAVLVATIVIILPGIARQLLIWQLRRRPGGSLPSTPSTWSFSRAGSACGASA